VLKPADLSKEQLLVLLENAAKTWLAHDGLWFLAVEKAHGLAEAVKLDAEAWAELTVIEAKRIKKVLNLPEKGGLPALKQALNFRLYAYLNQQDVIEVNPNKIIFRMTNCRVQAARNRKNLPDFPCKPVGIEEYSGFARTIDPRIKTRCIACPPDAHPPEFFCAWEFSLKE
jgi:hypothetical protein